MTMGWNKPIIKNVQTAIAKPVKYISLSIYGDYYLLPLPGYFCKFTKINLYKMAEKKKKHYLCQKYNY